MKASELRIGNLIYDNEVGHKGDFKVTAKDIVHIQNKGLDTDYSFINLSEEWLIDFGFEVDTWGQFILDLNYKHLNGRLMYSDFCTMSVFSDFSDGHKEDYTFQRDVIYVHQLQNLYFTLTGKELTIK